MSVSLQLVPAGENTGARTRAALIERHLSRFPTKAQPRLRAFAREHAWTADLVVSFPALAAMLALGPRSATRDAALAAVLAGAPLARVAAIAKTPLWLRSAPPEVFATAPPSLPDDPDIRRSIANHFPKDWKRGADWLDVMANANDIADSKVALWFTSAAPRATGNAPRAGKRDAGERLVALFAWLSKHQRINASNDVTLWNPAMKWHAALSAAHAWRETVLLELYVLDGAVDPWFEEARIGAYDFVALRTAGDLAAEGAAMTNCVGGYGYDLASDQRRVWSVRKDGARVATVSLRAPNGFMPVIDELSGPGNALVDDETMLAVHRWVSAQDPGRFAPTRYVYKEAKFDQTRWRMLWRDWWRAKKRVPSWLPLCGSERLLYAL